MKKVLLSAMIVGALAACDSKKETTADCVAWIYDNTRVVEHANGQTFEILDNEGEWLSINNEKALELSSNWTMNEDMKFYVNDDIVEEHEQDACETKGRVKAFLDHVTELKKTEN